MTIKQLLVGTAIGATALGVMLHRLPKHSEPSIKPEVKSVVKLPKRAPHAHKKHSTEESLSMGKMFG